MAFRIALLVCLVAKTPAVVVRGPPEPLAAEDRELVDGLAHAVADGIEALDGFLTDAVSGAPDGLEEEGEGDGEVRKKVTEAADVVDDNSDVIKDQLRKSAGMGSDEDEAEETAEETAEAEEGDDVVADKLAGAITHIVDSTMVKAVKGYRRVRGLLRRLHGPDDDGGD